MNCGQKPFFGFCYKIVSGRAAFGSVACERIGSSVSYGSFCLPFDVCFVASCFFLPFLPPLLCALNQNSQRLWSQGLGEQLK